MAKAFQQEVFLLGGTHLKIEYETQWSRKLLFFSITPFFPRMNDINLEFVFIDIFPAVF